MKLLISLLFGAGLGLAQTYQDNYHNDPKPVCESEDCLISGDIEMGLVHSYDGHGFAYEKLNTSSALSDVLYEGNTVCFRGSARKVVKILEALAGNDERNYYDGGHQLIEDLMLTPKNLSIGYDIKVHSDYGPYTLKGEIKKCAL